ncbi:hypothetical protein D9M68_829010 [compost metagenome]
MPIGARHEHLELPALAPRPVLGGEIGAHGMETERHGHSDQVGRSDDDEIGAQQFGAPIARNQRLDEKDQPGTGQARAEYDGRLRGEAPLQAHSAASSSLERTWLPLVLGLRQALMVRRNA